METPVMTECDRCHVAQAHVLVERQTADGSEVHDLQFCGHHFKRYQIGLIAEGFTVTHDTRDSLVIKIESAGESAN